MPTVVPGDPDEAPAAAAPPRLLYLHPLAAGAFAGWPELLSRAASLGFSHVVMPPPFRSPDIRLLDDPDQPHPALQFDGDATALLAAIESACRSAGLRWMLDLKLDGVATGGRLARERHDLFREPEPWEAVDPARPDAVAAVRDAAEPGLAEFWTALLERWRQAGAAGFRLSGLATASPRLVGAIAASVHKADPATELLGALDDIPTDRLSEWRDAGLHRVEIAVDRWDEIAPALLERARAAAEIAPLVAAVERPFGPRFAAGFTDHGAWLAAACRMLHVAAALGDGWLMPQGYAVAETLRMDGRRGPPVAAELSIPQPVASAIRAANDVVPPTGPLRLLPSAGPGVDSLARASRDGLVVTLVNRRPAPAVVTLGQLTMGYLSGSGATTTLAAGEVRTLQLVAAPMIRQQRLPGERTATERAQSGRVAIEAVSPAVDDGRFAAKRTAGDVVTVECDVICDGHDQLAVAVQWRAADQASWRETRMTLLGNDRWTAACDLPAVGRWNFRIVAWRDLFATFRDELTKKHAAGLDVSLEVREGRELVEAAAARSAEVATLLAELDAAPAVADRVTLLLSEPMAAAMQQADARPFSTQTQDYPIDADRPLAGFAAWYEIFPRSMSGDGKRHGTFRDVIGQLPRIRDMGFDVLYFPPIHPIGRINRKGRNNSLTPAADDPGSPYAIGSSEGGHDALHPELGSFDDFEALRLAALDHGLELAIDFAIQCAPDHPWLAQHKGWFDWRPDGSLRYAENPPKKYEDIVNVDFYAPDAVPGLWVALSDVVFFWLKRGVRIFRVDNPHTKPFPFWEWLISEVRSEYPDAIFLAEAFTRPKVMNRLGKVGFHQSYTYFTWRNTRAELEEYLTQLSTSAARDIVRPNFFVNTPDINPVFLQQSGRAGFLIRAALAATMSGLWGVYCGFELCEASPVPGREEYLDSEKYQLRAWDWERPGNIVAEITRLNAIRRMHPALWSQFGVSFLPSDDGQVLFFEKATPDRSDVLLIAVSLDPYRDHSAAIELPLWRWGLSDQATIDCRDVVHDVAFTLTGKYQRVALSPAAPYTIWHAHPQGPYSA